MNIVLRKHQREIVEVCREILSGAPVRRITLSVTPGGGKSFVPVILADNLIPVIAEKICWVVPRNSLKYQGEAEFCKLRWQTSKRVRAAENGDDLTRGLDGYVTTHQAIGQNAECHKTEFGRHKYILFLDEFHHVAEGSEWHKALEPLVKNAALVVLASGTLSRGDGERIAFLNYADGEPLLENSGTERVIRYTRSEAVKDGAVLKVEFNLVDGDAEWEEADGRKNESKLSGKDSAKALFTALRTEFANNLLDVALREHGEMVYNYRDAKMLVVAPNIEIAKAYYDYIAMRGRPCRIATSEDTPQARKNIEDFKKGAFHILITVAMAYEGLDVPDVSVIACLSHIRSVPWLEQCFARANRRASGKYRAVIFAPADFAIKKAVRMIEEEQLTPLNSTTGQGGSSAGQQEGGENSGEGGGGRPWIIPLASRADGTQDASAMQAELPPCGSPSEAEKIVRKNINDIIRAFLGKQARGNKQAHRKMLYRRLKNMFRKPIAEMNQSELEEAWVWVKKEYGGKQ